MSSWYSILCDPRAADPPALGRLTSRFLGSGGKECLVLVARSGVSRARSVGSSRSAPSTPSELSGTGHETRLTPSHAGGRRKFS